MHCIIYAAHQRLITPKMHPAKDALEHGCITPMMQLTKDASYQRYNALKMQCTKESSHWRCIAPDIHPTKDIIYQRCTICAARQNYNAPNMNQTVLSLLKASHTLRSSHLEPPEQPMARNACFMAFLGHFWPPWRTWGQFQWVQMAPTDHPECIPPRSNQDPLKSSHLEPPEPLMP